MAAIEFEPIQPFTLEGTVENLLGDFCGVVRMSVVHLAHSKAWLVERAREMDDKATDERSPGELIEQAELRLAVAIAVVEGDHCQGTAAGRCF
jgi:hypothetical protein